MRNPHLLLTAIYLTASSFTATATAQEPQEAQTRPKSDIRVLVTGRPGSARLKEFAEFLRCEFKTVGTTSFSEFLPDQAADYDVVILDCEVRKEPGRIGLPPTPKLPMDYNRASVLVSSAGSLVGRKLKTKINWH